ncbi:MAG: hypothetical protein ACR2PI_28265 [Hyphomicrobiaceae bacterium]
MLPAITIPDRCTLVVEHCAVAASVFPFTPDDVMTAVAGFSVLNVVGLALILFINAIDPPGRDRNLPKSKRV